MSYETRAFLFLILWVVSFTFLLFGVIDIFSHG